MKQQLLNNRNQSIQAELYSFAETTGKYLGLQNLPKTKDEFQALFVNVIQSKVQGYIQEVMLNKKPHSQRAIANATQELKDAKVKGLMAELSDKEIQKNADESELSSMPYTTWSIVKYYCIKCIVYLISFAESILVYQALRSIGVGAIGSLTISLGIGIGIAMVTEYIAQNIKASSKGWVAWVKGILITLIAFAFFYGISTVRVIGIHNDNEINKGFDKSTATIYELPAEALASISTMLFVIGLLITLYYGMSKDEKASFKLYCKKRLRLFKIKRTIRRLNKEIEVTNTDAHLVSSAAVTACDDALSTLTLLTEYANHAKALFIATNLKYRPDASCPSFFASPIPFHFTIHTHHLNTLQS